MISVIVLLIAFCGSFANQLSLLPAMQPCAGATQPRSYAWMSAHRSISISEPWWLGDKYCPCKLNRTASMATLESSGRGKCHGFTARRTSAEVIRARPVRLCKSRECKSREHLPSKPWRGACRKFMIRRKLLQFWQRRDERERERTSVPLTSE